MKKIILLCSWLTTSFSAPAQTNSWIRQGDFYTAYKLPAFRYLENTTRTIDFTSYTLKRSEHSPGDLDFTSNTVSKEEAYTAALVLAGNYEIKKYNISMDKPNIIPYKNGCILIGYSKEKKYWEFGNFPATGITEHKAYVRYDVVKK